MNRRSYYEDLVFSGCECSRGSLGSFFFESIRSRDVTFEADKVVFECGKCGEMIALFYRKPEIERSPYRLSAVDAKAAVGRRVGVPRVVAWVGYAKNTRTVGIPMEREEEYMRAVLLDALRGAGISATLEQVGKLLLRWNAPSKMVDGLRRHARWQIFKEAFATNPSPRGLWFQDVPFEGVVQEIVTCRTGKYDAGGHCYDGDWDPPYLRSPRVHRLYGCVGDDGCRALVWPGDVQGGRWRLTGGR